jgi:hypothetical protein
MIHSSKMKAIIKTLAAGLIVLLAACNKENAPVSYVTDSKPLIMALSLSSTDPCANPLNPYDSIGLLHNIALDSLRHYVKASHDTTRLGKSNYLHRFFQYNYGREVTHVNYPNEKLGCLNYKAIMLQQKVSPQSMGFFKELSCSLDSIKDTEHYGSYKGRIVVTENKILEAGLSEHEKRNLLITASVLRYSGYYWMNAFNDSSVQPVAGTDGIFRKIAGVIAGIGSDATVVAYCYFHNILDIVDATVTWSAICGYYTGWY